MQQAVTRRPAAVSRLAFAQAVLVAAAVVVLVARQGGSSASERPGTAAGTGSSSASATSSPSAAGPTAGSASSTSAPAAPSTTASAPGVALPARLLAPPARWHRVPDAQAATGPLDLVGAAKIDGGGALSRTGLRQMGFRLGISRAWQTDTESLLVLAYQFGSAAGARQYVMYATAARNRDSTYHSEKVFAVPSAHGFSRSASGSHTNVVIFPKGNTAYILGVVRPTAPRDRTEVDELAQLQYDAS